MGKTRELIYAEIPIRDVDSVDWFEAGTQWLRGASKSRFEWIGVRDGRSLPMAVMSVGPAGGEPDAAERDRSGSARNGQRVPVDEDA